jgi:arabinogalactan endo-1,4-beta-galactosidase
MTTSARRRGSLLVAILTALAFALSLAVASPASAASPQMENKERPWLSGPVCLEIDNARAWDNADATVDWCSNYGNNMQWTATYVGYDGAGLYYQLKVAHSGKCLDVLGNANTDGAQVVQNPCASNGGDWAQQWRFVQKSYANGKYYYEVVARHSGKCLDKSGWNVIQYNCHGGDWQQWSRPF